MLQLSCSNLTTERIISSNIQLRSIRRRRFLSPISTAADNDSRCHTIYIRSRMVEDLVHSSRKSRRRSVVHFGVELYQKLSISKPSDCLCYSSSLSTTSVSNLIPRWSSRWRRRRRRQRRRSDNEMTTTASLSESQFVMFRCICGPHSTLTSYCNKCWFSDFLLHK